MGGGGVVVVVVGGCKGGGGVGGFLFLSVSSFALLSQQTAHPARPLAHAHTLQSIHIQHLCTHIRGPNPNTYQPPWERGGSPPRWFLLSLSQRHLLSVMQRGGAIEYVPYMYKPWLDIAKRPCHNSIKGEDERSLARGAVAFASRASLL